MLRDLLFIDRMVEVSPICLHMGRRECSLVLYQHRAFPLHKHLHIKPLAQAFGLADAEVDLALAEIEKGFSLAKREKQRIASAELDRTCISTSAPHSLGTCLETGIYTTGGGR